MARTDENSPGSELRAGWPVVLTASMGVALAAAMVIMQGVMIIPIEHEFGWTRARISSGALIVSTLGLLLSAVAGYVIDRIGARRIGLAVAVSMSGVLILLAATPNNIWYWWLMWGIYGLAATATSTVWLAPVSARFDKSRGLAIALTLAGTGISATLLPIIANYLIEQQGWRTAYFVVGVLFLVVNVPLTFIFWRGAEEAAQPIDDDTQVASVAAIAVELPGMTVREGFRSPNFYIIVGTMTISMFAWVALVVNIVPILISLNISAMQAAAIAGTQGLAGIAGRVAGGWVLDRVPAKWLVCAATLCTLVLPVTLIADPGSVPLIFGAVIVGAVMSGVKYAGIVYLVSRHFGPRSFGTLFGAVSTAPAVAAGVGPVLASYAFDVTKSYSLAIWAALPAMATAALLVSLLSRYPDFEASPLR
jgi:MFS family permease